MQTFLSAKLKAWTTHGAQKIWGNLS